MQTTLADFRTRYSSLGKESHNRLGQLNHQISKLNETVAELRKQVKDLSDEKERLASQAAAATSSDSLKTQLAAAVQEKETTAKLLADEMSRVTNAAADHEAALSASREERDKLLAGKHKQGQKQAVTAATERLRAELQNPEPEATSAPKETPGITTTTTTNTSIAPADEMGARAAPVVEKASEPAPVPATGTTPVGATADDILGIPRDLLLPAGIGALAVAIIAVFTISRLSD
ncbi:MLP1_5 [Sanghuangporus sanghuang]